MREPGYSAALRVLRDAAGGDLQQVIAAACEPVPAWDPIVYLGDFSGEELFPLTPGEATEDVAGSMAGRAFSTGQPVTSERDDGIRVWVPVSEQASRTGVLAVTIADDAPETLERAELLGVFAGLVIAAAARVSDVPYVRRQGQEMSLPAGMQWDLLPPLNTRTPGATIAGPARARLRHRRRRVRLLDQRRSPGFRDHRRDGPRHRLDAADRARRRRLPARAPPRRLHRGHARGHRPGAHQQLRRRLVRHRHRRQARVRHRAAGVVVRRASAAAAAARAQGRRGAGQRAGPSLRPAADGPS